MRRRNAMGAVKRKNNTVVTVSIMVVDKMPLDVLDLLIACLRALFLTILVMIMMLQGKIIPSGPRDDITMSIHSNTSSL
jgi:hypothetical protein